MTVKQQDNAIESFIKWLNEQKGNNKKPAQIEITDIFTHESQEYAVIKFKEKKNDKWKLGVCGGYKINFQDCSGIIWSEDENFEEDSAIDKCKSYIQKVQSMNSSQVDDNLIDNIFDKVSNVMTDNKKQDNAKSEIRETKVEDLIIAKKNNKYAIFNKEISEFLTEHLYDMIILSYSGNHIVCNYDTFIDEDGNECPNNITYSAIVDNQGHLTSFPTLEFGFNGAFNMFNVCPARFKETNKVHLVDANGNILSAGYDRIYRIDKQNDLGIYCGVYYYPPEEKRSFEDNIKSRAILNYNGKEIKFTISSEIYNNDVKVAELQDINNIESYIKSYGPNIIKLIPEDMFKEMAVYPRIISAVNKFAKSHQMLKNLLLITIELLENKANIYKPIKTSDIDTNSLFDEEFFSPNPIEKNYITKKIKDFCKRLNLI